LAVQSAHYWHRQRATALTSAVQLIGRIVSHALVGGLQHQCVRI